MDLSFEPMTRAHALKIAGWRYESPYALYNVGPEALDGVVQAMLDPATAYFTLEDPGGTLVGFRCFGPDARVRGGDYSGAALDTGGGLRPDLTGRGLGARVLEAGLAFGRRRFEPEAFRVTVAAFNHRALKVCRRVGFRDVQAFARGSDGRQFVVLHRDERH